MDEFLNWIDKDLKSLDKKPFSPTEKQEMLKIWDMASEWQMLFKNEKEWFFNEMKIHHHFETSKRQTSFMVLLGNKIIFLSINDKPNHAHELMKMTHSIEKIEKEKLRKMLKR